MAPESDGVGCHVCGGVLDPVDAYARLHRVTSDCRAWPASCRRWAAATRCYGRSTWKSTRTARPPPGLRKKERRFTWPRTRTARQPGGRAAPPIAARTAAITAGDAAPAATATLQACEACSISVLFGGGALFEFWASASQQRFRLGPATPPVGFLTSAESDGTGSVQAELR